MAGYPLLPSQGEKLVLVVWLLWPSGTVAQCSLVHPADGVPR